MPTAELFEQFRPVAVNPLGQNIALIKDRRLSQIAIHGLNGLQRVKQHHRLTIRRHGQISNRLCQVLVIAGFFVVRWARRVTGDQELGLMFIIKGFRQAFDLHRGFLQIQLVKNKGGAVRSK